MPVSQEVTALYALVNGSANLFSPSDWQHIEFELDERATALGLPGRVEGYAIDGLRIVGHLLDHEALPSGWHAYSVGEDETDEFEPYMPLHAGEEPVDGENGSYLSVVRIMAQVRVNHRLDFVTTVDLSAAINADLVCCIPQDDWGFTGETLETDVRHHLEQATPHGSELDAATLFDPYDPADPLHGAVPDGGTAIR
ncbi:MAG: hypothetical protein LKI21_07605 [Bifidobacterium crudilactis]|jgi:hypothetical protein|nr:hypothetical protein [Bifidobacterium crudilactis]